MAEQIRIQVNSIRPVLADAYVAPIADELSDLYGVQPTIHVDEHEPPAAEFTEIALYILMAVNTAQIVAAPLVTKLFEPLVTELGERLRDRVLDVIDVTRARNPNLRVYVPLVIAVGQQGEDGEFLSVPVHYVFHGRMNAVELLRRLRAAEEHLKTIPPELLSGAAAGPPGRFFWDSEQGRWRGHISRFPDEPYGEEWYPPDLWE